MKRLWKNHRKDCPCIYKRESKHPKCSARSDDVVGGLCEFDKCPFIFWFKTLYKYSEYEIKFRKFEI